MMNVQYITDSQGKALYVQVPVRVYENLLADAKELADITAYKKAKRKQRKWGRLKRYFVKLKPTIVNGIHNV